MLLQLFLWHFHSRCCSWNNVFQTCCCRQTQTCLICSWGVWISACIYLKGRHVCNNILTAPTPPPPSSPTEAPRLEEVPDPFVSQVRPGLSVSHIKCRSFLSGIYQRPAGGRGHPLPMGPRHPDSTHCHSSAAWHPLTSIQEMRRDILPPARDKTTVISLCLKGCGKYVWTRGFKLKWKYAQVVSFARCPQAFRGLKLVDINQTGSDDFSAVLHFSLFK